ncbi:hypothetical protein A3Q56_08066 [Intoshia linei]|uniref:Uncharacterized protein n=1 Tax=Intoshia linei TaxID=1819745 RepID=A0A177AQ75_9BILA|nr:hypothetical protein A3Q56_08066 [Intoshia linei]
MENKDLLNNLNEKFKNKLHTIYKICNQNENLDASLKSIDFLVNINKNQ